MASTKGDSVNHVMRCLLCLVLLTLTANCAFRPDGPDDAQGDDDDRPPPQPQPNDCQDDGDCDNGPTACHIGSCSQGTCSYASSCDSGEVCNAQDLCEEQTTPPPPSGNGTIVCTESGSQTQVTISNGILAHLFDSVSPNSNWQVAMIDGFAVQQTWVSDSASYTLTMPNTIANFTLAVKDPSGQKHWFDVSEFDVTGTCARGTGQFTHSTSTTPPPNPGNGTLGCQDVGTQTYVTVSAGILAHVFNQNGFTAASLRFGYGLQDYEAWVSDNVAYTLTMPSTTPEFNLFVRDTAGVDHWFDVNQFNVTGTCSKITGAFTHTVASTGNGNLYCSDSGGTTTVTISNGILPHVFNQNGFTAASLRFGYGLSDWESWVSDSTSYVLTMPSTTPEFNLFVRDTAGVDHWFDVNQFNVTGTCSKITGAFTHSVTSVGNGSISCSESGSNTNVTVSGGILAHLSGTPGTPSLLQFAYGGSQTLSWNGDGASYTFTMGNTITNFNFQLRDVNANTYAFDVTEFNVSGTCSKTSTSFTHTVSAVTIVGTIKCRLWDVGGITKREVTITPNGNGIIAGTFQEGTPVTSPESIRLNVDGQQQTWVGNGQPYIFYPLPSVNDFNFFVVDNDDVANGGDTVSGGDWFNLAAWTIINESSIYGTSNCHMTGGGINVN
ncbi:MAG: hypothetical protein WC866_05170 [Patescibacteria group bacterium]|jgi:hypothetical protein